jgi:mxaJ protein
MSSDFRQALLALAVTVAAGALIDYRVDPAVAQPLRGEAASHGGADLKVCADPNNLPFSNEQGKGFENALATLVAKDLGRTVRYTWWPQRRGFVRNTLSAGGCDVVMGVPSDYGLVATTVPYYRSTYVFVTRRDRHLRIVSLDDPQLKSLRIGTFANVPPAQALAVRNLQDNLRGYSIYGNYLQPNPPRALIDAVAHGDVDVAIAWGPLAGYFAEREPVALDLAPIPTPTGQPTWPMSYSISMGVRHQDGALKARLDAEIARRRPAIEHLLASFGVPLVEPDGRVRMPRDTSE